MVVTYSPKRAKKDKSDRERVIEKAKKLLTIKPHAMRGRAEVAVAMVMI